MNAWIHVFSGANFDERLHVVDVRVDAAVRDEAEQVDVLAAFERAAEDGVLEERAVLDRLVHADEVLEEDATGTDRQVADLGVAHLALREPDGGARRFELCVREIAPEPVEDGGVGELDSIPGAGRSDPPAVEDDERYERERPASHIARKESTSSEAPPTSAPSTSGWAKRPAALSGLTEPP